MFRSRSARPVRPSRVPRAGLTTRFFTARFLTARFLTARFLTARFLTARFLTARFLTTRFLTTGTLTAAALTAGALTTGAATSAATGTATLTAARALAVTLALPAAAPAAAAPAAPAAPTAGERIGTVSLPRGGKSSAIREGVSAEVLERAVGHYPGTQLPGRPGNAVLFGHRTMGAAPFADLDKLRRGDVVDVRSGGARYRYRVRTSRVVTPNRTDVLNATPFGSDRRSGSYLTLITCTPKGSNLRRLVVVATLERR
ncbi:class E sortase [Actinomadura atramentaria]|uniref:class E sortase n=1 Tax=Actinomadura atramentaria TaxID=1990 RepID=UPI0003A3C981|nr:class E sortase [Actinomadura atramentaria]